MYLVDTNIWLERLLAQEREKEVASLLDTIDSHELAISDFAAHCYEPPTGCDTSGKVLPVTEYGRDLAILSPAGTCIAEQSIPSLRVGIFSGILAAVESGG